VSAAAARLLRLLRVRREVEPAPFVAFGVMDQVAPAVGRLFEAERLRADGSSGDAEAWWAAVEACDTADLRWEQAVALRWLGASLLDDGAGRTASARALRAAHEMALQMGAVPLRQDVEILARSARIELAPVGEILPQEDDVSVLRTLTKREREILAHLVTGRSYSEIAEALFISDKTVSVHVSNILRKTGARNRVEASALGRRHGLVAET
jgi:DNA-binding NarL/FixJ family response regulator